jgi:hypothetical protein
MHRTPRPWLCLTPVLLAGCASSWTDPSALTRTSVERLGSSNEYRVSCTDTPRFCDEPAKQSCPSGYDVIDSTVNPSDYGRTTLLIRCR